MNHISLPRELDRIRKPSLVVGAIALLSCVIGGLVSPHRFFESYLAAYLYFLGIALGSTAMLMVHQLVGGNWGKLVRRFQEAATASLPVLLVLFIPILFGLAYLYPWADPERAGEHIFQLRKPYMTGWFFALRTVAYFAIWIVMGLLMKSWAAEYDRHAKPAQYNRLQRLSAGGLVIYVLTMSFATADWIMSREPHWYSTVIGFIIVSGQALSGFAAVVLLLAFLVRAEPFSSAASRQDFNDLGNILLTMVILFAYMSFVQFLIQWYGNTQEDIQYYVPRLQGGWAWVGVLLIAFHFFVPFFLLLMRFNKRHERILGTICVLLLVMRLVDNLWLVLPSGAARLHWTLVPAIFGIGGIWLASFLWILGTRPLLIVRDPALAQEVE